MSLHCRVIQTSDVAQILKFENQKLKDLFPDPVEREFAGWKSKAREESLNFYIPLGWSLLVEEDSQIFGFALAQPLLFLNGLTQSLWVEYISTASLEGRDLLVDSLYRLAREKHFQGVYFPSEDAKVLNSVQRFKPDSWSHSPLFVATTRMN